VIRLVTQGRLETDGHGMTHQLKMPVLPLPANVEGASLETDEQRFLRRSLIMKSIFPVTKKDLRIDTFCSGGPGGQHQNKTHSGVRLTHVETGISAECRDTRSQHENRKRAFRKLAQRLLAEERRRTFESVERCTTRIRTYHEPRGIITDHRTGNTYSYERVIVNCKADEIERMINDSLLSQNID